MPVTSTRFASRSRRLGLFLVLCITCQVSLALPQSQPDFDPGDHSIVIPDSISLSRTYDDSKLGEEQLQTGPTLETTHLAQDTPIITTTTATTVRSNSKRSLPDLSTFPEWHWENPKDSRHIPEWQRLKEGWPSRYRYAPPLNKPPVSVLIAESQSESEIESQYHHLQSQSQSQPHSQSAPPSNSRTHDHLHCKFTLSSLSFDLCSLFEPEKKPFVWRKTEVTPPTVSEVVYWVGLGGPLEVGENGRYRGGIESGGKEGKEVGTCPEGTWVCMIKTNKIPSDPNSLRTTHIIPVAGNPVLEEGHTREKHPGLNVTARMVKWGSGDDAPKHLAIQLHGGKWANETQSAWIVFRCNKDGGDQTFPEFLWTYKGTHAFMWTSPAACLTNTDSDETPPPGSPPPSGGHEGHKHTDVGATATVTATGAPVETSPSKEEDGVPDPGDLPNGDGSGGNDSGNSGSGGSDGGSEDGGEDGDEEKKDFTVTDPRYPGVGDGKGVVWRTVVGVLVGAVIIIVALTYLLRSSHHHTHTSSNAYGFDNDSNSRFASAFKSLKDGAVSVASGLGKGRKRGYSPLTDGEDLSAPGGGSGYSSGGGGSRGFVGSTLSFVTSVPSALVGWTYGRSEMTGRSRYGAASRGFYRPSLGGYGFGSGYGRNGNGNGKWRVGERKLASWVEEEEVDLGEYEEEVAGRRRQDGATSTISGGSMPYKASKSKSGWSSSNSPRNVQVLFDSYVNDNDDSDELDPNRVVNGSKRGLMTNEELPLTPSPGRFGLGSGAGYQMAHGGAGSGSVNENGSGMGGRERGWVGYGGYGSVSSSRG